MHARMLGVDSLPIALFIALFTGIVLALLASYSFTGAVPLYFVGTLVEKTITMELAPVLTGLALAGRVGANIAAELGTMRVTEQIDALETLSYDPIRVPRRAARDRRDGDVPDRRRARDGRRRRRRMGRVGRCSSTSSSPDFVKGLRLFFTAFDVRYGLVKSASFGAAVTLIGCMTGHARQWWGGGRGPGRDARGRLFGDHDSRARRVLGHCLAPRKVAMKRTNDFVVGLTDLVRRDRPSSARRCG